MPQLVAVVLTRVQICHAIAHLWAELGVSGATILDSAGVQHVAHALAPRDDLPLMPSLRAILDSEDVRQQTLFTVVPDNFDLETLIARTEERVGSFDGPDSGILFVVPVTVARGLGQSASPPAPPRPESHAARERRNVQSKNDFGRGDAAEVRQVESLSKLDVVGDTHAH